LMEKGIGYTKRAVSRKLAVVGITSTANTCERLSARCLVN
jgi:hypothetical protein